MSSHRPNQPTKPPFDSGDPESPIPTGYKANSKPTQMDLHFRAHGQESPHQPSTSTFKRDSFRALSKHRKTISTTYQPNASTHSGSHKQPDYVHDSVGDDGSANDEGRAETCPKNLSFMFKKHDPSLIHNISKISNRLNSFSRHRKNSEYSASGRDTSRLLRSLSLDDSKLSMDSKYNEYLAEFDGDSEQHTTSRLVSSCDECSLRDGSHANEPPSAINHFSKSLSFLDVSQVHLKRASLLGVSKFEDEAIGLEEKSSDNLDESAEVGKSPRVNRQRPPKKKIRRKKRPKNDRKGKVREPSSGSILKMLEREQTPSGDGVNADADEGQVDGHLREPRLGTWKRGSFSLENTQRSILSDFSFDENQKESFMRTFGYTRYHEKFFQVKRDRRHQEPKPQTVMSRKSGCRGRVGGAEDSDQPKQQITLKMFACAKSNESVSTFVVTKRGLRGSTKNSRASEIVIGREGNKSLRNGLVIHDISLRASNRTVSRMHCMLDCYFAFRGTFRLTRRILFFLHCVGKRAARLRRRSVFCRVTWARVFEYLRKPRKIFLFDFNSTTRTFLRLPFGRSTRLTLNMRFMLGDDACFTVERVGAGGTLEQLQKDFPESVWLGFDDLYTEDLQEALLHNRASGGRRDSDRAEPSPAYHEYLRIRQDRRAPSVLVLRVFNASSNIRKSIIFKTQPGRRQTFGFGRAPENEVNVNLSDISRRHLR